MDILARFLLELSRCFSRKVVLGEHKQHYVLFPNIVASNLTLRKEEELYLLSGKLEMISPLDDPLRNPEGAPENPIVPLGVFLSHSANFKGAFDGHETLEVFQKDKTSYSCVSIAFHSYPLMVPSIFSITQILGDPS